MERDLDTLNGDLDEPMVVKKDATKWITTGAKPINRVRGIH